MLAIVHDRVYARCDRCLASTPLEVLVRLKTLDDARRELAALFWELREGDQIWCLECSRRAREVQLPTNARGVRRRRR